MTPFGLFTQTYACLGILDHNRSKVLVQFHHFLDVYVQKANKDQYIISGDLTGKRIMQWDKLRKKQYIDHIKSSSLV